MGGRDSIGGRLAESLTAAQLSFADEIPSGCSKVVVVVGADPPPRPMPVTADLESWRCFAEHVPHAVMQVLQRARTAMTSAGGRIVVVFPTLTFAGSANLVSYTTGMEAIRALAKSAARQWGSENINVNLVGVPTQLIVPALTDNTGHITRAARDGVDLVASVIASVRFLLEGELEGVTGSTIIADGGAVMLP